MGFVKELKEKVLGGEQITKEEAMRLYEEPLEEVCTAADEIRRYFCEDRFDRRIVNTVHNRHITKHPQRTIHCWRRRRSCVRQNTMQTAECSDTLS